MQETNDISIGQDKWIKWIELDPNSKDEFEIDSLLEPTKPFWENLETECVAECCGLDAFSFWPEDIQQASKDFDTVELKNQLIKLRDTVIQSNREAVVSERLNNLIDKKVFVELIDHILRCL